MSYVLYGLVIAALAIVIVYFSKVEEDEKPETKGKKVLQIQGMENKNPNQDVEQLKMRLNEQIEHHDHEYQQTLIQVREAENNRKIEYNHQVDNIKSIEMKLMKEKDDFMKEKQELLQQKIEFQKQQLDDTTTKSHSKINSKSKKFNKTDKSSKSGPV